MNQKQRDLREKCRSRSFDRGGRSLSIVAIINRTQRGGHIPNGISINYSHYKPSQQSVHAHSTTSPAIVSGMYPTSQAMRYAVFPDIRGSRTRCYSAVDCAVGSLYRLISGAYLSTWRYRIICLRGASQIVPYQIKAARDM